MTFVLEVPIDNNSALVKLMAWCQTGDKALPEPMMAQFTDLYRHLPATLSDYGGLILGIVVRLESHLPVS